MGQNVMIRNFEPSDMNQLVKLARAHAKEMKVCDELPFDDVYYIKSLRSLLVDPINHCFVVEKEEHLIGYAIIFFHTKIWNPTMYGQMAFFYLMEGERNKWLADSLFNACVDKCKNVGAQFFESSVCAWTENYKGSKDPIERASTYFEHKKGEHCGNIFVHNLEEA
jgi:GNAT superfamily N-acetyltransferase